MQKNKKLIIVIILTILLMHMSIASINPILKLNIPHNSIYNGTNGSIVFGSSAGPFSSNILINGVLVNTTNIGYISKNINLSEATQSISVHNGTIYAISYPFSVVPIHTVNVSSFSFNTELYTIPNGVTTPYTAYSSNMALKYIINTSSSDLQTIYTSSNTIANTIVGFNKPIGVYTIPNSNSIYVLNNGNNTISLINSTFHVTKILTTGNNPQSIAFSSNGVYAYVPDYTSNSVTVINVLTNTTVKNILINGACPSSIAYSNSTNSIYVADSCAEESGVSVINGTTNSYVGKISINGWLPIALSASPMNGIIYVGYTNIASLSGVLGEINVSEGYVSVPASANTYTITLNSNANANYNANSISSTFTISKAHPYIFLNNSKNFVANGKDGYIDYGLFNKTASNNMNATLYVNGVLVSKSYGMQLNKTLNESTTMNIPEGYISNLALTNNGNDLYLITSDGKIADFNTISNLIVNNLTYAPRF
ncbi:MAG: YncE family protein [Candidatus Marsarchaeota archaeon]|nr:YncE family protein [Candidatus Marsarchaeota archaeon]